MVDSQISVSSGTSTKMAFFESPNNSSAHYSEEEHPQHSRESNASVNSIHVPFSKKISLQYPTGQSSSFLELMSVEITSSLSIADVAELLHSQHAIITGGRSSEGYPLILFPDNNDFNSLEEADYKKLIRYLTSIPS